MMVGIHTPMALKAIGLDATKIRKPDSFSTETPFLGLTSSLLSHRPTLSASHPRLVHNAVKKGNKAREAAVLVTVPIYVQH